MGKIGNFFREVKTQMGKVAWPSKDELVSSTVVVLGATLFLGIFIGLCDLVLSRFVSVLISGVF